MARANARPEAAKASVSWRFLGAGGIGWNLPRKQNSGDSRNAPRWGQVCRPRFGNLSTLSETILPGTQSRENRDVGRQRTAAMLARRLPYRFDLAAQKRVGLALDVQSAGQAESTCLAQLGYFADARGDVGVVWLNRLGETQIAQRVLMRAIDQRVVGALARRVSDSNICSGVPSKRRPQPAANSVSPLSSHGWSGSA